MTYSVWLSICLSADNNRASSQLKRTVTKCAQVVLVGNRCVAFTHGHRIFDDLRIIWHENGVIPKLCVFWMNPMYWTAWFYSTCCHKRQKRRFRCVTRFGRTNVESGEKIGRKCHRKNGESRVTFAQTQRLTVVIMIWNFMCARIDTESESLQHEYILFKMISQYMEELEQVCCVMALIATMIHVEHVCVWLTIRFLRSRLMWPNLSND